MKVLIPSQGEDIHSKIDSCFAKSKFFILVDTEKDTWEVIENKKVDTHSPEKIAHEVIELNIHAIVVKQVGPHIFDIFNKAGVKVYFFEMGEVKEAIDKLKNDQLKLLTEANKQCGRKKCD